MKTQTMINLKIYTKLLALRTGLLRRLPVLRRGSSVSGLTAPDRDVAAAGCSPLIAATGAVTPSTEGTPIMIVRADQGNDLRLDRYLEQAGFQVLPAETVAEATNLLSRGQVRLVLLDLEDGDDGTQSIQQLQLQAGRPRIPLMVLTPRTDSDARVAALHAGADDCLAKPASPEEVLARVRAILRWSPGVGPRFVPAAAAPVL